MRFGAVATMTLSVAVGFVISTPACNLIDTRPNASGSTGGNSDPPSSSGGTASGGTTKASGGSGGSAGKGGSGGNSATGGSGGSSETGGDSGSGGDSETGGTTARGGASGVGGRTGSGGATARGGSGGAATSTTTVSNCTDTPPPDQSPTCAQWADYGMCSQSWFATYCDKSCGRCTGTSNGGSGGGTTAKGGASGSAGGSGGTTAKGGSGGGGATTPGSTNPQITGTNGFSTRYWDCCKPSCGWSGNSNPPVPSCGKDGSTRVGADARSGCEGGGTAFECYDFAPWYDPATNMSYGFAAKNGVTCGACFMIQFTGDSHNGGANEGAAKLKGQQMVVQAINIGGIEQNQFDLLIPGGGVGLMTQGCTAQWGNVDLGDTYGGLLSECKGDPTCMKGKCQSVFGSIPGMKAGCDWFTGWFSSADNPNLVYKQVSCPQQITSKTGLSK